MLFLELFGLGATITGGSSDPGLLHVDGRLGCLVRCWRRKFGLLFRCGVSGRRRRFRRCRIRRLLLNRPDGSVTVVYCGADRQLDRSDSGGRARNN